MLLFNCEELRLVLESGKNCLVVKILFIKRVVLNGVYELEKENFFFLKGIYIYKLVLKGINMKVREYC